MTHRGSVHRVTIFNTLLPACSLLAISRICYPTPQKPSVLALASEVNKSFSTGNPFISRACPYTGRWGVYPSLGQACTATCFSQTGPSQSHGLVSQGGGARSMGTLPTHYPVHMYNAVAGGIQRLSSVVHPPLPHAMRLANLHVASLLRNFGISLLIIPPPPSFFYSPWRPARLVCVVPCRLWYYRSCPPTNTN